MSDACAAIVARDDPHLHATALFAPEPGRSRLMVLYAFDVELSRAASASAESLIARMRLQWWRDVVASALAGAPAPAHEVAGPFARLLAKQALPGEAVEGMIAAREAELEGEFDAARFAAWADARFGGLTALAAHLLTRGEAEAVALARRAGPVLGAAFALRHAAAMAGQGGALLPELAPEDRAALAGGELTGHAGEIVGRVAEGGLARLSELRAERGRVDRQATPAFLPLVRARRVLGRAVRVAATGPRGGTPTRGKGMGRRASSQGSPGEAHGPASSPGLGSGPGQALTGRSRAAPGDAPVESGHDVIGGHPRSASGRAAVGLGELDAERAFDGLRLAWAAATGRW